ncbi:MAG: acyltransferase family protein [Pseudomonadota bacterium]
MKYRTDIDGLRALAIVPVVLYHAGLGMTGGFVGVDVFFVISGYLLSRIVIEEMQAGDFRFLAFYERRFRRLAPAFVAMLIATYIAFYLVMLPEDFEAFSRSALGAIFFYANFHLYGAVDYFSQSADLMPLLHMWSLAIEEQFYAVLPLAMMITLWVFPRRWLPWLIGLALLGSFALCIYYTYAYRPFAFYMPHTRAWELLAGTLLAALPRMFAPRPVAEGLGLFAIAALVFSVFAYDARDAFPGYLAALPVLATAALIYTGEAAPESLVARFLSLPPLVFIGKISYSLYLWHWPVIVFVNYTDLAPDSALTQLTTVALSVGLATLSWALVEQPVRRRRVFASRGQVYAGAFLSAVATGLFAAAVIRFDGLPNRVPVQIQALLENPDLPTEGVDCFFIEAAATATPCLRGAPEVAPSFILVGDSHAFAMAPGFWSSARREAVAGLQYIAPAFFPGLGMRSVGASADNPRSARMLDIIAAHPDVGTIVLQASWADYALGSNWKGRNWLYQDDISVARSGAENAEIFTRALERLIMALPEHQIILLDDVPAGLDLDLNYYARRTMLRDILKDSVRLPAADVAARRAAYVPIFETLAAQHENVQFFPVFETFCAGPEGCGLFAGDNGAPLYRDGDHLSNPGAMLLSPLFDGLMGRLRQDARIAG